MKIQYCSDLHLELKENSRYIKYNPLVPSAEILILAGDITYWGEVYFRHNFFDFVADNFELVLMIAGNHEFYHGQDLSIQAAPFCKKIRENVFLVNHISVEIGKLELIFTTLWSKILADYKLQIQKGITDFYRIKFSGKVIDTEVFNEFHKAATLFLRQHKKKESSQKSIIVSHHLPSIQCVPDQFIDSSLNSAFASDLDELILSLQANYWIYGHSHRNTPEFKIGKTTLLTNQLGYVSYREHQSFKTNAVVNLKGLDFEATKLEATIS